MSFYMPVKSTLDKLGSDIAKSISSTLDFVELDDTVNVQERLQSNKAAIVWSLDAFDEDPQDPLYALSFSIGAKTTADAGNYYMAQLIDAVNGTVFSGAFIPVFDYSGTTPPTQQLGNIIVTDVVVNPQQSDAQHGLRMIHVNAKAIRG